MNWNICQFWGLDRQTACVWACLKKNGACTPGCLHGGGDKPSHEADSTWARSGRQHIAGTWRWLEWSLSHTKTKWHNDEINKNTVDSLKPCGKRQQSPTCFHFVLALTVTMFFWRTQAHVVNILYSTGCSLVRSSARGAFALQAGTSRPSLSTAWRWGLPFIYTLRANCYSHALARQRCILCPSFSGESISL